MFMIASYETFQDGQIIFEEGSNGDWIYVVEEGEVEISKRIGTQKIVIETLKENEIFGEIAYIDKHPGLQRLLPRGRPWSASLTGTSLTMNSTRSLPTSRKSSKW